MLMLGRERFMPVRLAPAMDRFDRTREAVASRELAHDRIALPRPRPDVVEAEEVECRVRIMAPTEPRSEVHIPRLGLMEREPEAPKTPTQNGEHSPTVLFIRKGHNGVLATVQKCAYSLKSAGPSATRCRTGAPGVATRQAASRLLRFRYGPWGDEPQPQAQWAFQGRIREINEYAVVKRHIYFQHIDAVFDRHLQTASSAYRTSWHRPRRRGRTSASNHLSST